MCFMVDPSLSLPDFYSAIAGDDLLRVEQVVNLEKQTWYDMEELVEHWPRAARGREGQQRMADLRFDEPPKLSAVRRAVRRRGRI